MRARSELETSFGSLFVLDERARPSGFAGGGAPSAPGGPPEAGSSVWMKQHLLPYGQEPETQKVYDKAEVSNSICGPVAHGNTYSANFRLVLPSEEGRKEVRRIIFRHQYVSGNIQNTSHDHGDVELRGPGPCSRGKDFFS